MHNNKFRAIDLQRSGFGSPAIIEARINANLANHRGLRPQAGRSGAFAYQIAQGRDADRARTALRSVVQIPAIASRSSGATSGNVIGFPMRSVRRCGLGNAAPFGSALKPPSR